MTRRLVVNADDLGLSSGVNDGIARACRDGIVTSASLMVHQPAATEAAELARCERGLSIGLHVDLGEWVAAEDDWVARYERVDLDDGEAIDREIRAQLGAFLALVGRPPTHLDSHQHVHRREPVRAILRSVASELAVPLREDTPGISYCGAFYGADDRGNPYPDAVGTESLIRILHALPDGVTELSCHPAAVVDIATEYADQRPWELATLCDVRVRTAVAGAKVGLVGFGDLGRPDPRAVLPGR